MEIITIRSIILLVFFTSITVAYSNNQFGTFTMEARADSQLDKWFDSSSVVRPSGPEYVEYEMIEG